MEETDPKESEETQALEVVDQESLPEEQPEKILVDHSKLYVWVADTGNDRIQKFDGNGNFLWQFGKSAGTRPPYNTGEFKTPQGVAGDSAGDIWVADTGCHRIQKFDADGDFMVTVGTEGWGQEKLYGPESIIAEPTGTILVVDRSEEHTYELQSH